MVYLQLFGNFFLIGLFSFGGGYAMLPLIERQVTHYGWMSTGQFTDVIAISGMLPGSIGTNAAVFIGYQTAGISGAAVAALGMIFPSFLLVLLIGKMYQQFQKSEMVSQGLYGLKPVIVSLIFYSAIKFTLSMDVITNISWQSVSFVLIFLLSLLYLFSQKGHPVFVIILAGLVGVVLYH